MKYKTTRIHNKTQQRKCIKYCTQANKKYESGEQKDVLSVVNEVFEQMFVKGFLIMLQCDAVQSDDALE